MLGQLLNSLERFPLIIDQNNPLNWTPQSNILSYGIYKHTWRLCIITLGNRLCFLKFLEVLFKECWAPIDNETHHNSFRINKTHALLLAGEYILYTDYLHATKFLWFSWVILNSWNDPVFYLLFYLLFDNVLYPLYCCMHTNMFDYLNYMYL